MENSGYKFRVWDGKEYHYDIAIYDGKAYIPDHGLLVEPVENAIIEQYTGLKDKNGKEIYEGDIIVIPNKYPFFVKGRKNYVAVVERELCGFQSVLYCVNPGVRVISHGMVKEYLEGYQVIGNINETPELLKDEQDESS